MRIAIVGSRNFPDRDVVARYVRALPRDTIIVSGGAKGVDRWAVDAARDAGLPTEVIEADWQKHGRSAGPIRNHEIVRRSDRVVAFWDGASRGTLNTVALAIRENIAVSVRGLDGEEQVLSDVVAVAKAKGIFSLIERALSGDANHN